jgi:hypothetical protein
MSDLLIKMAQAAVEDKTLFAPYIQQYASQKSLSWEEVAGSLQIGREQLAKLALCGRPQPAMYDGGMLQVADYVGMDRALLNAFMAEVEGDVPNQSPGPLKKSTKVRKSGPKRNLMAFLPKKLGWAAAAVLLIVVMLGAFVFAQPTEAAAATLVVNQGQATIVHANPRNAGQMVLVPGGEALVVSTGDRIFLAAESTARIHLVDGSTIDLEAGAEINVDELVIEDDTYRVHLRLLAGRTLSRVKTVLGVGDRFEISTPSSTASVRGTVFTVAYISANETYISCDEGQVEVSLAGQESQMVEAGMEVTAVVGRPLQVKLQQASEPTPVPIPTPRPEPVEAPEEGVAVKPEKVSVSVEVLPILNGPNGIGLMKTPGAIVTICHQPGTLAEQTLTIPILALNGHLDHGDIIGICSTVTPTATNAPTDTVTPTETPVSDATEIPVPDATETPEPDVTICHQPGTPAQQTMSIPASALDGHLGHGDMIGPCPETTPEPPDDPLGGGNGNGNGPPDSPPGQGDGGPPGPGENK